MMLGLSEKSTNCCSAGAWLTSTQRVFAMPAIVEFPHIVADAIEHFADLFPNQHATPHERTIVAVRCHAALLSLRSRLHTCLILQGFEG